MQNLAQLSLGLACCLSGGADLASSQSMAEDTLEARVDEIVAEAMQGGDIGGMSIAMSVGSGMLLETGWGVAPDGSQADASSVYGAGSLLEQWIRVAVLTLVEADELTLDATLSSFFPDVELDPELRLEHLLAHTSGLPYHTAWVEEFMGEDGGGVRENLLRRLSDAPLESTPGDCFAFSRTNTLLLGWILEDATGESVPALIEESVFDASGMDCTSFDSQPPPFRSMEQTAWEVTGKLEWDRGGPQPFRSADVNACAADILAWQGALLDRELLSEKLTHRMITSTTLTNGSETHHGYGLNIASLGEHEYLSHGGGIGSNRLHVAYYPAFDLSLALLATGESAPLERTARRIVRAVFDLPEPGTRTRPLPEPEREKYVGRYNIGCTQLVITSEEDHLALEAVDYPRFELHYQGRHRFIAESNPEVHLTFEVADGVAVSFVLEEYGTRSVAVRFQ